MGDSLSPAQQVKLRNRLDRARVLLHVEDPFTYRDLAAVDGVDVPPSIVYMLHRHGFTERLRRTTTENWDPTGEYRAVPGVREAIWEMLTNRETLPCGHRAHVSNPRGVDGYSCQYCDDAPVYDEETVRAVL